VSGFSFLNARMAYDKTVDVTTAGTLYSLLTPTELASIQSMEVKGNIDARDFRIMRDSMPLLNTVNLTSVLIEQYTGTEGTNSSNITYKAREIPQRAFINKLVLSTIVFPDSITFINSNSFQGTRLTSVTIPDAVTGIDGMVFFQCASLVSVSIGASVASIPSSAFSNASQLTNISINPSNQYFSVIDDVLFNSDTTELILYPDAKIDTTFTIPSTVLVITQYSIEGADNIRELILSNSLQEIDQGGIDCLNLKKLDLPASVTNIYTWSIRNCPALSAINVDEANTAFCSIDGILYSKDTTKIIKCPENKDLSAYVMPSTVKTLGGYCFHRTLYNIELSNSVEIIEGRSFDLAKLNHKYILPASLQNIQSNGILVTFDTIISLNPTPPTITSSSFNTTTENDAKVYVPKGTSTDYISGWVEFTDTNFIELPSVTFIVINGTVPVMGARVTYAGQTLTTDASGKAEFIVIKIGESAYSIETTLKIGPATSTITGTVTVGINDSDIAVPANFSASEINAKTLKVTTKIYPNPVNDKLFIELDDYTSISNMKIVSVLGQVIYSTNDINSLMSIDLSDVANGIMFLKIEDYSGNVDVKRIVKQ
jgi:hypothetical protein